ncbi:MAG: hypothetical protein CFE24_02040 [Flavobacterium sp. BFFFF2]|nr:MAG: hypothetical protein CFE24_02040 [Flavobacterium sp. BFFFF2]
MATVLFKDRVFGDYLTDTFQFFRERKKHFFGLFFKFAFPAILLALVLIFGYSYEYNSFMFSNNILVNKPNIIDASSMLILRIVGYLFGVFLLSIFIFSFPIIYFKIYERNPDELFGMPEVWAEWKLRWKRIVSFYLISIVTLFPLMGILIGLNILLIFILIGLPLLMVTIPMMILLFYQIMLMYVCEEYTFSTSFGEGIQVVKRQFWPLVGATLIMMIVQYMVQMIFSIIPMLYGFFKLFTSLKDGSQEGMEAVAMSTTISTMLSMLASFFVFNIIYTQQLLMHYSYRESTESKSTYEALDELGKTDA